MAKIIITTTSTTGAVTKQTASESSLLQFVYNWLQDENAAVINIEKPVQR